MYTIKLKRSNQTLHVKHVQRNVTLKHVGRRGPQGIQGIQGIPGNDADALVSSVNGEQGAVILDTDDIDEGDNKYISAAEKAKLQGTLVESVVAGTNVTVDNTDPENPIVNASGGGGGAVDSVVAGNNIDVDATDPANPIVAVETLTAADISDLTASATELNYTDGVTSAIQTQLNNRQYKTIVTVGTSNADYITDGTADNVEINAAIDAVSAAGGGKVFLKAGTYVPSGGINVKSGVYLEGEGYGTYINLPSNVGLNFGSGVANAGISRLRTSATSHTGSNYAIIINNSTNICIEKCHVLSNNAFGILVFASGTGTTETVWVRENYLSGRGNADVIGGGPGGANCFVKDVWIEDNWVYQDASIGANYATAIDMVRVDRVSFTGNKTWGKVFFGSEQSPNTFSILESNIIQPANGSVIADLTLQHTGNNASADKADIIANNVVENGRIRVQGHSSAHTSRVSITGNNVTNGPDSTFNDCILLQYVDRATITGNILNDSVNGVNAENSSHITIASNDFSDLTNGYNGNSNSTNNIIGLNNFTSVTNHYVNISTTDSILDADPATGNIGVNYYNSLPPSFFSIYEDSTSTGAGSGLTIEQDGTGDAIAQFLLTGTRRWALGIDNSDSDKFKIAANADVGVSSLLSMTTAGAVTLAGALTLPGDPTSALEAATKQYVDAASTPFVTVGYAPADYITDGTDDHLQIQAAVDALSTENGGIGGTVFIKDGTYDIGRRIVVLSSDMTIRGNGMSTKLVLADNVDQEIFVVGNGDADDPDADNIGGSANFISYVPSATVVPCNNVNFYDLYLDGNKANQDQVDFPAIRYGISATRNLIRYRSDALTSEGADINNVFFYNGRQNGLSIESHKQVTVKHIRSQSNDIYGIWGESGGRWNLGPGLFTKSNVMQGIKIFGSGMCNINGWVSEQDQGGIVLQSSDRVQVSNFVIRDAGYNSAAKSAITLASTVSECTFSNGNIQSTWGDAIEIYGDGNGGYNKFDNITIKATGQLTTNTYSDIHFKSSGAGRSKHNRFSRISSTSTTTNVPAYALDDDTGGHTDNHFRDCQFVAPYGTAVNGLTSIDNQFFNCTGVPNVTTKTADYTVTYADEVILVDASAGARIVYMPVTLIPNARLTVKKIDSSSNGVTVHGNGVNIDGASTRGLLLQNQAITVTNNGTEWYATSPRADVSGPSSSTDNAITRFDGVTGRVIQNSTATLSDGGTLVTTALGAGITPVSAAHVYQNTTDVGTAAGLTIEQNGTGDAVTQYLLTGGRRWVLGIDNSDSDKFKLSANADVGATSLFEMTNAGVATFTADVHVPDEVYGVGWNGSTEVPTKNALYDKIETISGGGGISEELVIAYAMAL